MNRHRETLFLIALVIALIVGAYWLDWSGCARVCEANGDANGWDVRRSMGALEPVLDELTGGGDSAYVALERALSAIKD